MAIPFAALAEGTRVKVKQGNFPLDPVVRGRNGLVVAASEYNTQGLGVILDGESEIRYFGPSELESTSEPALPPEREAAKRRSALP